MLRPTKPRDDALHTWWTSAATPPTDEATLCQVRQFCTSQSQPDCACLPRFSVDESARVERLDHLMYDRRRDAEEPTEVCLSRWRTVNLAVVIDEREVLALLGRERRVMSPGRNVLNGQPQRLFAGTGEASCVYRRLPEMSSREGKFSPASYAWRRRSATSRVARAMWSIVPHPDKVTAQSPSSVIDYGRGGGTDRERRTNRDSELSIGRCGAHRNVARFSQILDRSGEDSWRNVMGRGNSRCAPGAPATGRR
jgi:hypothetical protein